MSQSLARLAGAKGFQNLVTVAILIAGVLVGIETYAAFAARHASILSTLNSVILGVFVLEIVIKMGAEGTKPWRYFKDGWNIFDFLIVVTAFVPFGSSSVAVLRLLRLLRVLKLVKALPKLQMLVGALLKSIPSMGYVSILLLLLFYIYAVAATLFFGENDPVHFVGLPTSFLSLFRIVTLEDWTDIMYINMFGCDVYGYDGMMDRCVSPKENVLGSALFFVSFVLIGTMVFLNLFIGVIMEGMNDAKMEMNAEKSAEDSSNDFLSTPEDISLTDIQTRILELQALVMKLKIPRDEEADVAANGVSSRFE